jgi:hypothetical protein
VAQLGRLLVDAPERFDRLARRLEATDDWRAERLAQPPRATSLSAALWTIAGILLLLLYHFS